MANAVTLSARVHIDVHHYGGENRCDGPRRVVLTVGGIEYDMSSAEAKGLSKALRDAANGVER